MLGWARSCLLLGLPPHALEWCVQDGEACRWCRCRPGMTSDGITTVRSCSKVCTLGWLSLIVSTARFQWLTAQYSYGTLKSSSAITEPVV